MSSVPTPAPASQPRPLGRKPAMGKPKPLNLASFIILDPEAMMKLDGHSISGLWKDVFGNEKTFKGIQRFLQKSPPQISDRLKNNLAQAFDQFPDSALKAKFLLALNGDREAQEDINALGQWEFFRHLFPASEEGGPGLWIDQLVEIETASQRIDRHLEKGEFARAAEDAEQSPPLRPYLSVAAIARLSSATSDKEALFARTAGLCEVLLSQMARVECLTAGWANYKDGFAHLMEFEAGHPCAPGVQFFARMKSILGAKTLAELVRQAVRNGVSVVNERTLQRWSSGDEFPRADKLDQFIDSINAYQATNGGVPVPYGRIQAQYWAAKRLQKLLELARLPWEAEARSAYPQRPWSEMMEYGSAEAWIQARYPFWQNHWEHHFRDSGQEAEEKKG